MVIVFKHTKIILQRLRPFTLHGRVNEERQSHSCAQMDSVSGRKAVLPVRAIKPGMILRKLSNALLWHPCKQRDFSSSEIRIP